MRIFPERFVFFILAAFWALMNGKLLYAILFPALVAGNFAMMRGYIWYNWNELENLIRSKVI